jgi:hypothetical protein
MTGLFGVAMLGTTYIFSLSSAAPLRMSPDPLNVIAAPAAALAFKKSLR